MFTSKNLDSIFNHVNYRKCIDRNETTLLSPYLSSYMVALHEEIAFTTKEEYFAWVTAWKNELKHMIEHVIAFKRPTTHHYYRSMSNRLSAMYILRQQAKKVAKWQKEQEVSLNTAE